MSAPVFRDPADWARQWGWLPPLQAKRAQKRLEALAEAISGALDDEGAEAWIEEIYALAAYVKPKNRWKGSAATRNRDKSRL